MADTNVCPRCKSALSPGAKSCGRCGLSLARVSAPEQPVLEQQIAPEQQIAESTVIAGESSGTSNVLETSLYSDHSLSGREGRATALDVSPPPTAPASSTGSLSGPAVPYGQKPQEASVVVTSPEAEYRPFVPPLAAAVADGQSTTPILRVGDLPISPIEVSQRPNSSSGDSAGSSLEQLQGSRVSGPLNTGSLQSGWLSPDDLLRTAPLKSSILAEGAGARGSSPEFSTTSTGRLVPRGAFELLPQESVAFQMGALYLTTKRVILLAPTVIRSAFVRDIDAVGTFTERASGWFLVGGLMLIGLAIAGVYASAMRHDLRAGFGWVYLVDPMIPAALLALLGIFLLVWYFRHVKRTLFVSVKGRPLITVSISDWNSRKLEGMDSFVNSFFQIKDLQTGELIEREARQT